jgi:hypothetical protein
VTSSRENRSTNTYCRSRHIHIKHGVAIATATGATASLKANTDPAAADDQPRPPKSAGAVSAPSSSPARTLPHRTCCALALGARNAGCQYMHRIDRSDAQSGLIAIVTIRICPAHASSGLFGVKAGFLFRRHQRISGPGRRRSVLGGFTRPPPFSSNRRKVSGGRPLPLHDRDWYRKEEVERATDRKGRRAKSRRLTIRRQPVACTLLR